MWTAISKKKLRCISKSFVIKIIFKTKLRLIRERIAP